MEDVRKKVPYVALNMTGVIGAKRLQILKERFGDLLSLWEEAPYLIGETIGAKTHLLEKVERIKRERLAEKEIEKAFALGARIVTIDDEDYPAYLKEIDSPPIVLYVKGELVSDAVSVAIVGTRNPTAYGRKVARDISSYLAGKSISVVSGLAYGVDSEAHIGAIMAGGRTVAVMGTGIDIVYPRSNASLAERILDSGGTILTEYPLGTQPSRRNFPLRNRIISGISQGVVIVEAPLKSGALITARFALEQNREVFVVPGSIYNKRCEGSNLLMQQGAYPILKATDILQNMGYPFKEEKQDYVDIVHLDGQELEVARAIDISMPVSIDEIVEKTGLRVECVMGVVVLLELKGVIMSTDDGKFVRLREVD